MFRLHARLFSSTPPQTFASLPIHPLLLNALASQFSFTTMTPVQQQLLSTLAKNEPIKHDLFVKAKTGTGKTLAFLLASMHHYLQMNPNPPKIPGLGILCISPTRELAGQIKDEWSKLLSPMKSRPSLVIGGVPMRQMTRALSSTRIDFMSATPGRMLDILHNYDPISKQKSSLQVLILDEADQLLDMGFRNELLEIEKLLPKERLTFMFSATLSPKVKKFADMIMDPSRTLALDTVEAGDDCDSHAHIKKETFVAPCDHHIPLLYEALKADNKKKSIVFFPTSAMVDYYALVLRKLGLQTTSLHARYEQDKRSRISAKFRAADRGILLTTDVSARGLDYPNVGLVVQMGNASSRDSFIHRIGRTGRGEKKEGKAVSIFAPFEEKFIKELEGLGIESMNTAPEEGNVEKVTNAVKEVLAEDEEKAYKAISSFVGYTTTRVSELGMKRDDLDAAWKEVARSFSYVELPRIHIKLRQDSPKSYDRNNRSGGFRSGGNRSEGSYNRSEGSPRQGGYRSEGNRNRQGGFRSDGQKSDSYRSEGRPQQREFRNGGNKGAKKHNGGSEDAKDFLKF